MRSNSRSKPVDSSGRDGTGRDPFFDFLARFLESLPEATVLVDEADRVVLTNNQTEKIFGYPRETLIGSPVDRLLPERFRGSHGEFLADARFRPIIASFDLFGVNDAGQEFPIEISMSPIETGNGTHVLWAIRDISQRKKAELGAAQDRKLLQSIIDHLGDGVVVADHRGKFLVFNPAARRIVGVGLTGEPPERWPEVYGTFHPETLERFAADDLPLVRALAGEECRDVEMLIRNPLVPDGVIIQVTATPIRDGNGQVRGGVIVFRDVTSRKRAEDQVRSSERRFRMLAENIREVFWMSSPGIETMYYVSPAYEDIWGRPVAELFDRPLAWTDSIHPEDRARVLEEVQRHRMGRYEVEYRIIRPDGTTRRIRDRGFPIHDDAGQLTGMCGVAEDITDAQRAQDVERYRDLTIRMQAAREGERARIAREIHDELGQVLTGVKFEVSLLAKEIGSDASAERLSAAADLIDTAIGSVRRIAADLRPPVLDEAGLFESIRWQANEFQKHTGIACEVDLPTAELALEPEVATAVFRILQEALTNVARHAAASRVVIRMTVADRQAVLLVRDDGRGIRPGERSGTDSLGLLGMEERARQFGGEITVEGEDGRGTTLTVRVPA